MEFKRLLKRKSVSDIIKEAELGLIENEHTPKLRRALTARDLTFFGIAAVIGTGVFTAIGSASASGGPGVVLLFAFTAVACCFAAYCYAEFASMVPISGSAYTYSYVAFGEIFAWIIGWDLLMEYAIGNIAVAISWSDYFTHLMSGWGINFPQWMTMDYFSAHSGFNEVMQKFSEGVTSFSSLDQHLQDCYNAWQYAPYFGPLRLIMDIPALAIVAIITAVVFVGIRESRTTNNIFVFIKLAIIFLVIVLGSFYVHPANWSPFAPNGLKGIMSGVSAVFFAYIGFDAISTTAEECKEPQKDMPRAMFNTLIICTSLYIVLVLVLTGMVNYTQMNVGDPLAFVFSEQHSWIGDKMSLIISVSAIIVIASVLLVYQMGQPRIWMSMSRDGLLWKRFSKIHPRFKTPSFATIVTGLLVAIPALFMNLDLVISLTSIGTLFAFVLVCGGILVLQNSKDKPESRFKTPYVNGKYLVPLMYVAGWILTYCFNKEGMKTFFTFNNWDDVSAAIPMTAFIILATVISFYSYLKNFSLIPVLGMTSCFYLMTGEKTSNWLRFLIWLAIGLVVYFIYGYQHSKLRNRTET